MCVCSWFCTNIDPCEITHFLKSQAFSLERCKLRKSWVYKYHLVVSLWYGKFHQFIKHVALAGHESTLYIKQIRQTLSVTKFITFIFTIYIYI